MKSLAVIPIFLNSKKSIARERALSELLFFASGIFLLACLAQITIPVPWSPVPITGQTFGVALIALCWGSKRAGTIVFTYLSIGALGLPVFAQSLSGFAWGPTLGYLVGMQIGSICMGYLADRGFTNTFFKALFASYCGSLIVFICGLTVLSFFVPTKNLLMMGLYPFLLGDLIKNSMAAYIAWKLQEKSQRN